MQRCNIDQKLQNHENATLQHCLKITKMLQQSGCPIKIIQNVIRKAINRNQNSDA